MINQKEGFIKSDVIGGRLNYSARNVIIPDPTLRADSIKIGYKCFMELYKPEIISLVVKITNITENEAHSRWNKAMIKFNPGFYKIMQYIINNYDPCVLVNRNPTINYGSIVCMNIVEVTPELDSYTMKLPIQILSALNADLIK